MPIFCVKSVKIYTGQKRFTRIYSWRSWQIWGMSNLYVAPLIIPCDHPRHWVLKMQAHRDQLNNCIMNALKADASCLSVCDWANVKRWSKTSVNIWRCRNLNFDLMPCWLPCLSSNLAIYCFRASCNVEVESQIGGWRLHLQKQLSCWQPCLFRIQQGCNNYTEFEICSRWSDQTSSDTWFFLSPATCVWEWVMRNL